MGLNRFDYGLDQDDGGGEALLSVYYMKDLVTILDEPALVGIVVNQ